MPDDLDDIELLATVLRTRIDALADRAEALRTAGRFSADLVAIIGRARKALDEGRFGEAAHYEGCAQVCALTVETHIKHAPDEALAEKVRRGPENRQDAEDKAEIRNLAERYWRGHPDAEVFEVVKIPGIAPFTRYYRPRTIKDWIKGLKPGAAPPAVIP